MKSLKTIDGMNCGEILRRLHGIRQKNIFLMLWRSKKESFTAHEISQKSIMGSTQIYQTLNSLHEKGIVKKKANDKFGVYEFSLNYDKPS